MRASGGADVGAFQSGVNIGSEIHITTALAGRVVHIAGPSLAIAWTGGDPDELVTAWFVEHFGYEDYWSYGTSAPASAGTLNMSSVFEEGAAELIVEVHLSLSGDLAHLPVTAMPPGSGRGHVALRQCRWVLDRRVIQGNFLVDTPFAVAWGLLI